MSEPSVAEIATRQQRLEAEQRDQWDQIHATRDRVSAAEAGMQRLWEELHGFRRESREDAREITGAIADLTQQMGSKANVTDETRLRKLEGAIAQRRGALSLIGWIAAVAIPAVSAIAGTVYYIGSVIGG